MTNTEAAALVESLTRATEPGARMKLVARGLARGIIWRDGKLPEDAPAFSATLTTDLLDHGYSILAQALEVRDFGGHDELADSAFRVAAEAIESAVRKGDVKDEERGFHLLIAASAFHLGHYAARSYCLLTDEPQRLNLSTTELALAFLLRRSFRALRQHAFGWLRDDQNSDATASQRIAEDETFWMDDLVVMALTRHYLKALATFDYALETGSGELFERARTALVEMIDGAAEAKHVPLWWVSTITRHLIDDLWNFSLHQRLPLLPDGPDAAEWQSLRNNFIYALGARDLAQVDLWPSQLEAAARSIDPEDDLVVALPTSAGKTRIAELAILRTLASKKRIIYVTPLRALSAQVEWTLAKTFRPLGYSVSSLYGASGVSAADIGSLKASNIVVATPEKMDFAIRQQPDVLDDVGLVVLDEGHMIGLGTREIRYEVLVQRLLQRPDAPTRRIVCLSAIFNAGDTFDDFTAWIRTDNLGQPIRSLWRPTRQRPATLRWTGDAATLELLVDGEKPYVRQFVKSEGPKVKRRKKNFPQDDAELVAATVKVLIGDHHRVLVYCPRRTSVETFARLCLKLHEQKFFPSLLKQPERIKTAQRIGSEWMGADHPAVKALEVGIALHHGALPRPFLAEVERLLNDKVLPLAVASPTLAQGIDLSCSALIFYSLYRGRGTIPPEEFANVVGRAGRAYVDLDGITILPAFDQKNRRKKIADYEGLRKAALERTMESGLLLLVNEIAVRLAKHLQADVTKLVEYVTNQTSTWSDTSPTDTAAAAEADNEEDDGSDIQIPLEHLLADLDTAILGTVDRLDCEPKELADLLDAALKSSLWNRRLSRFSEDMQRVQRALLHGRAAWIWSRSDSVRRKGFFAAGIGLEAGAFLHDNMTILLPALIKAESAIVDGNAADATQAIALIAAILFQKHPFMPEKIPATWAKLLEIWLSGAAIGKSLSDDASNEIAFIQQGIVFNLVWGIEAVRVQAQTAGETQADALKGIAALALTYGVPNAPAAVLLEAGLSSRPMAMTVVKAFNATFTDINGLDLWLDTVGEDIITKRFWKHVSEREAWNEFLGQRHGSKRSLWATSQRTLAVKIWDPFYTPQPGSPVRLVDDPIAKVTVLCDEDLSEIGISADRYAPATPGHIRAAISADRKHVTVTRWGPTTTFV